MTTLAGRAGQLGSADGTGADARFAFSAVVDFEEGIHIGMTVDAAGNVWLTDGGNRVVRRMFSRSASTSR